MAISFAKGGGKKAEGAGAAKSSAAKAGASKTPKWMKTGNAAKKAMQKEAAVQKKREEERDSIRRFWMPADSEASITFLDGDLGPDGELKALMFYEHSQVQFNGSYKNWFICTDEMPEDMKEPCPVCQSTGKTPSLVAVFTIIDHSEWKSESTGKVYKDQIKLFVCKMRTFRILQKMAQQTEGLSGTTFNVSRTSKDAANVGDVFIPVKKSSMEELADEFPNTVIAPADYEAEIKYYDATELRQMGFGTAPIGSEPMAESDDFEEEL